MMNIDKTIRNFIGSKSLGLVMVVSLFVSPVNAGEFHPLGNLPSAIAQSQALGMTLDGKTVVGMSASLNGIEAIRWTANDGMEVIGDLPGGEYIARALSISYDGSTIVGRANSASGMEAFMWKQETGMVGLGDLPGGLFRSVATRISGDGSVVVGFAGSEFGSEAMRWTASTGMQGLGDLPGGKYDGWALDVSSDGGVIVGWSHSEQGKEAFRWTKADGMQGLSDLPGGVYESAANGISDDGKVIVGYANNENGAVAVRWIGNNIEVLDDGRSGLTNTKAVVTSSNGAVIAGSSRNGVFIWDKIHGMRLLKDVLLSEYGIDLGKWIMIAVEDISPDGTTLVGYGVNNAGYLEGYVAKIDPVNTPPVANAGVDQTVLPGSDVMLDGRNSTDPDGDFKLKYHWTISYKPQGSVAVLSNADIVNPVLVTDKVGDYVIDLIVSDSFDAVSKADSVTISTVNSQPVANAGDDQSVILHGSAIELNGGGSHDPDGDAISYMWSFIKKPIESKTTLNSDSIINPVFIADVQGTYELALVVTDTYGFVSKPDVVIVSFNNLAPVAKAGIDQNVFTGTQITLNGDKSSDPNMDGLSYRWVLVSAPEGSTAIVTNTDAMTAGFVPDAEGTYVVGLVVNDGLIDSPMDNMIVTAINIDSAVLETLDKMVATVKVMDPSLFKRVDKHDNDADHDKGSKKHKKGKSYHDDSKHHGKGKRHELNRQAVFVKKIMSVKRKIAKGEFEEAVDKLSGDVMKRIDGCAVKGDVDRNDWLRDCSAQQTVYPLGTLTQGLLKLLVR